MFQSIHPPLQSSSFRLRLKTAFSPSSVRSAYASSSSSTSTTSPLSRRDSDEFSPGSFFSATSADSRASTFSASSRLRALLMRHHKPSVTDLQLQEERRDCGRELGLLEPRPQSMFVMAGFLMCLRDGRRCARDGAETDTEWTLFGKTTMDGIWAYNRHASSSIYLFEHWRGTWECVYEFHGAS